MNWADWVALAGALFIAGLLFWEWVKLGRRDS